MKTKKIELSNLVKILPFAVLCIVTGIINPVFFFHIKSDRSGALHLFSADCQCGE